jgi:ACS family hexuronate transporter-like MFS transporter
MQTSKYRRVILTMVFLAMLINYLDRAALSVAMPFITQDFHLSASEKGLIFSSFFIGYTIFNFVGGFLADKFGAKNVFTWSMSSWSVLCGLTAAVSSFWSLLVVRTLFGIGEGPIATTANKVVNNWFPVKERARAVGINQAGGPLGGALAGPVVGFMAIWLGWQLAFVVIALIGILWAVVWYSIATEDPARNPKVSKEELAEINEGREVYVIDPSVKCSIFEIIFKPAVLITGISLFCLDYILFFFMTWFPTYLIEAKGVSLQNMSMVTALPWLAAAAGFFSGGLIIDWVYKKTGRRMFSRKVVLVTSLLIASVLVGVTSLVDSATQAVAVMTFAMGFLMLAAPAYWSLIQDTVPSHQVGTAGGFMHMLGTLSGVVGPTVTGFIIQYTGTFNSSFVLASTLGIIGALIIAMFIDAPKGREVALSVA